MHTVGVYSSGMQCVWQQLFIVTNPDTVRYIVRLDSPGSVRLNPIFRSNTSVLWLPHEDW